MATVDTADLVDAAATVTLRGKADSSSASARSGTPLLEPRPGGMAERFSGRIGAERPVLVFLAAIVLGYTALVGFVVALGLMLTRLLLPIGGFAAWEEGINQWLADHRNRTLEHLSWIGSTLAGGVVIPVVVAAFLVVFLALRHWRLAAFVLFVISVESGTYRATTLLVHRERPTVHRLESLPVDASFPSGHTAAALALFGGLLLVLMSRIRSATVTVVAMGLLVVIPLFVAWARMYRGMHHLTDSVAGVLLGIGALIVTVFAARAAGAAADRRDGVTSADAKGALG
jgi:membrane-associated phospholipid phosphatase